MAQLVEREAEGKNPLDNLAIAPALDQDARRSRTGLAGVLDARVDQERQRAVEVGVGEHQLRRFSAEFERDRRNMARRRRLHQRPDRDRAGKGKMPHPGVGGERRARLLAEARNDIERARRKTRFPREVSKGERSEAGFLRRLQDAGVAHRQRRADGAPRDLDQLMRAGIAFACQDERVRRAEPDRGENRLGFLLAIQKFARIYPPVDALARAYGPWWLCNDVTRPFWKSGSRATRWRSGPEREVDMVAIPVWAMEPCPDAVLRGTRLRGRGSRVTDPSSLS